MSTVRKFCTKSKPRQTFFKSTEADLVLDHAIYSKALEFLMDPRNLELKTFINLPMGSFHVSCISIAAIGKCFGGDGLKDLCIDSTLIEPGSIDSAMKGKQYNISVRGLKIVYEALQRLKLYAFEKWLQTTNKQPVIEFLESIAMNNLIQIRNSSNFCLVRATEFLESTAMNNFIQTRNSNNFCLVRTTEEGLFDLYQESDEEVVFDTGCLDTGVFSL